MSVEELRKLLESLGIKKLKISGSNFIGCCPNPRHNETRPSWGISLEAPHPFNCFSCGNSFRGTLYDLLILKGYKEAEAKIVSGDLDIKGKALPVLTSFGARKARKAIFPSRDSVSSLQEFFELNPVVQYLGCPCFDYICDKREVTADTVFKANLRYEKKDRRILFPWYVGQELLAVTGRTIDDIEPKILSYYGGEKLSAVYHPFGGKFINDRRLFIVEGEISALRMMDAGFVNTVALGRGSVSNEQISLIKSFPFEQIVIFTDWDRTGRRLARTLIQYLEFTHRLWIVRGPIGEGFKKDPADYTYRELNRHLNKSVESISKSEVQIYLSQDV